MRLTCLSRTAIISVNLMLLNSRGLLRGLVLIRDPSRLLLFGFRKPEFKDELVKEKSP